MTIGFPRGTREGGRAKVTARKAMVGVIVFGAVVAQNHAAHATNIIGTVQGYSIQMEAGGPRLFFAITGQPQATCTVGYIGYANYVVDLDTSFGRAVHAAVMGAHLSGRALGVNGTGTCTTDPKAEDVKNVDQYLDR